jgi:glycosyltransferase involved in cell wall biosynthesis
LKAKNNLCVIIPVYNEEESVTEILDEVLARPETAEIIVVDDASTDNSRNVIQNYIQSKKGKSKIKLLFQKINMGKGAAIRRGFDEATAPIVIVQDADKEYTPEDYPIVLEPIISGKADVVYGSRFQEGPGRVVRFKHRLGNKLITFVSNWLTDLSLTDVESCYKVFKLEVIQNLNLETCRFGIEVEMTAKLAKAKILDIYEVPISYDGRTYGEGKKITWKDGVAAFWHMIKYNWFASKHKFYKKPWKEVLKKD